MNFLLRLVIPTLRPRSKSYAGFIMDKFLPEVLIPTEFGIFGNKPLLLTPSDSFVYCDKYVKISQSVYSKRVLRAGWIADVSTPLNTTCTLASCYRVCVGNVTGTHARHFEVVSVFGSAEHHFPP